MTSIAETLIHPPFYCIVRADDPVKIECALNIMETVDIAQAHRVHPGHSGHCRNIFMIFGMGDLHLFAPYINMSSTAYE